jgi:tRNA(Leu) C34 or U34 (ribose-2'-O)-methylase TrmL
VLDGVTDPHNLGACLRVADGAGAHAVIAPKDHAAGINATVAKVASGAAETVPYFMVTNLARTLGELKERNIWCLGTSDDATHAVPDRPEGPVALVLGAEGEGMRQLTRKTCDELVSIPMLGAVESLNVSVASGVCLYEAVRQRGRSGAMRAPWYSCSMPYRKCVLRDRPSALATRECGPSAPTRYLAVMQGPCVTGTSQRPSIHSACSNSVPSRTSTPQLRTESTIQSSSAGASVAQNQ